jgi:hypothetical protein
MTKLAFGVGINDSDYPLNPRLGSKRNPCPFYTKWKDMLMRCYSEQYLRKSQSMLAAQFAMIGLYSLNSRHGCQLKIGMENV